MDVGQPKAARVQPIGAETHQVNPNDGIGRAEVGEEGDEFRHASVFGNRLSRKAVDDPPVVLGLDADFLTPTEQLDVAEGGGSLAHEPEHGSAEALDPGHKVFHAAGIQCAEVAARQVGADLIDKRRYRARLAQFGKDRPDVFLVQSIIDTSEIAEAVLPGKTFDLGNDSGRRLTAIGNGVRGITTEGALAFLSPPTSPGRLTRKAGYFDFRGYAGNGQPLEIIRVVGHGTLIEVTHRRRNGKFGVVVAQDAGNVWLAISTQSLAEE